MNRRQAVPALLALAFAGWSAPAALAHGGHDHVMGTLKTVDHEGKKLEVTARDGKVVAVLVNDKTKYLRGTAAAEAKDLAVGERVVIDAAKENGQLVAREVRLPAAKAGAAPQK